MQPSNVQSDCLMPWLDETHVPCFRRLSPTVPRAFPSEVDASMLSRLRGTQCCAARRALPACGGLLVSSEFGMFKSFLLWIRLIPIVFRAVGTSPL